jgi:hypothetical protein
MVAVDWERLHYLSKPIQMDQLYQHLHQLLLEL